MSSPFHLTVPADAKGVSAASLWARSLGGQAGLAHHDLYRLDLCVTELVTNIATYGYDESAGLVELHAETAGGAHDVRVEIIDRGRAFNPLAAARRAPSADVEINVGGLGIELVRGFADECSYVRRGTANVFVVTIKRSSSR